MKINFIEGDLLEATEKYIVHQVNCQGVMSSGIAYQIRDKYPNLYKSYREFCNINKNKLLGKLFSYKEGNKIIINAFSQDLFGSDKRFTNYEAVYNCFEAIRNYVLTDKESNYEIAFPYKYGSCRGGGDWNVIYSMITSVFEKTNIKISIYKCIKQ